MKIAPKKPQRLRDPQGCSQCPGCPPSLVESSVCCSGCTQPIVGHWWVEFSRFFAVLIPISPVIHPGLCQSFPLHACVCFSASPTAASPHFERQHPTRVIIKALHFPVKQGIGFLCLQYLSISPPCTCPVSLSALWDVSSFDFWQISALWSSVLQSFFSASRGTKALTGAFHKPPAEASWLFPWQNGVDLWEKQCPGTEKPSSITLLCPRLCGDL